MVNYVAGFLFNKEKDKVILVRKKKPDWQKGRLNGVGGKIEPIDLNSKTAMQREFYEETGVATLPNQWTLFCQYFFENQYVDFYRLFDTKYTNYFDQAHTKETEEILKLPVQFVLNQHNSIIYNLKWLIPLALDPSIDFKKPMNWVSISE